jgi:IclR family acetate operon transcriptional repressor
MKNSPPPSASPPPDAGPVTSVDNTLRLLLLIDERQALRVAEAADLLGVARSTAHRLLAALRRRDFVTQDRPNGAYRPGPALNALGLAAIGRIDIRRVARPILEDLREQTNETATLAILEGRMVRFVDSVESRRSVRVGNRTGVVRAAHASAVGKALLAELPRREFEQRYPDEHLDGGAAGAISTRAALEEELDQVRAQGYALNAEESIEGVSAVAVALRDVTGKPVAAMGLAAPSSRMRADALREIAPTMLAAADRIRQEMSRPV